MTAARLSRPFRFIVVAIASAALTMAHAARAQTFLRDAEIEGVLRDYSDPIFTAAGLNADSVGVHLLGDPTLNAFVTNGLNMFIFTGLITAADTPNQIKGVIAHETGHMTGGHLARSDAAIARATRPMLLTLALGIGAIAAGAPEAGIGIIGLGQSVATAEYLKYSRGQEASADQAGLTFLEATGQSGRGLIEFFGKLRNLQIISAYRANPYLQSHPLAGDRITALTRRAEASEYWDRTDTPEEIAQLKLIQGKIYGFLQDPNVTLRQYPLSDTSDEAYYARSIAYYRASNLDRALPAVEELIRRQPDNPFFQELKGQMLFEHGQVEEAIAPHRRSTELAPGEPLLKINLARAMIATEKEELYPDAIAELRAAVRVEPDNGFAWGEMARAYDALGNTGLSYLATAEARYSYGAAGEARIFAQRAAKELDSMPRR